MPTPQQPELRRSGHNAVDEGAPETTLPAQGDPGAGGAGTGPVPEDNLPGHHPEVEQDKPAAADFVAKAKEVAARTAEADEPAGARPAKRATKAAKATKATKATKKAAPRGRKAAEAPPTQTGAPTAEPEGAASPPAPTPIVAGTPPKRTPAISARAPRATSAEPVEPTQTSAPRADGGDGPTSPTTAQTRPTQATTTRPSTAPVASAPAGGGGPSTEADAPTATPDAVAAEATTGRTTSRPRPLIEVPRVDRGGDALRLVLLPLRVATFPARATLHVVTWLWRRR